LPNRLVLFRFSEFSVVKPLPVRFMHPLDEYEATPVAPELTVIAPEPAARN
jgi:hypothetical protein